MLVPLTDTACFHCGLPVADAQRWTVLINDKLEPMCCPGCQTVCGAIVAGGLENYYQYRSTLANKALDQQQKDNARFLAFDEPALQQTLLAIKTDDQYRELAEVQLHIEGIHCAACCWLIEHALQKHTGVKSISVSLATHKAILVWDFKNNKLSDLLRCIDAVGYDALPYQPQLAQQQLEKERRKQLLRLGIAGLGMMQAMMFALALYSGDISTVARSGMDADHKLLMRVFSLLVTLPILLYSAAPFFKNAWQSLKAFHPGMDVSVSLALLIAFFASVHATLTRSGVVYYDSISMFVFLLLLARYAEAGARRRFLDFPVSSLLPASCQCLPDPAQASHVETYPLNKIVAGNVLRIKPGEHIPLDGVVIDGNSSINEMAFSGEQKPLAKQKGDVVFAGTINGDGVLTVRVTHVMGHTRLDMISRLAEWGLSQKPRVALVADKLASVFTLLVLFLAASAGSYWYAHNSENTLAIVLSILVVSCPCALSLATPSALAFCYQALRKRGLLINSSNMIEQSRTISRVVFDKTGTLTRGNFSISATRALGVEENIARELASALEAYSEHPVALAFKAIASDICLSDVHTVSGKGVEGKWQGERYRIGSVDFCSALASLPLPDIFNPRASDVKPILVQRVFLVKDQQWLACFELVDELRDDVRQLIDALRKTGKKIEILSGDSSGAVEQLARQLQVDVCHSGKSPEQKLDYLNQLQDNGERVLMVGDGINDVPVLAKADLSIAMSRASDLAKIKADAILLGDSLLPILDLFKHSAKARRIIWQNLAWALLYNGIALPMAAMGMIEPWLAALGMSISSLWVTFNSLRLRLI